MTISNINNNLNTYLHNYLKQDLEKIHTEALAEISNSKSIETTNPTSANKGPREIKDEYVPSIKPKVEVTLEERLNQVISPEEIKNLLSLLIRAPRLLSSVGQLVDVKV